MKNFPSGPVGAFYSKYRHEEALGPVFVRKALDNYHVCVQDKTNPKLFEIVADVRNKGLADMLVQHLKAKG